MVHRTRGQGEVVPDSAVVLEAMGECRQAILHAQSGVRPFGVAWHSLAMVPAAIDAAALFMTGRADYYAIGGSIPASRGPMTSSPSPTRLSDFPWVVASTPWLPTEKGVAVVATPSCIGLAYWFTPSSVSRSRPVTGAP
jgi:hypothetical protein